MRISNRDATKPADQKDLIILTLQPIISIGKKDMMSLYPTIMVCMFLMRGYQPRTYQNRHWEKINTVSNNDGAEDRAKITPLKSLHTRLRE